MKRLLTLLSLLALAAVGFTACGGGDETSTSDTGAATTSTGAATSDTGGGTVKIEADPNGAIAYTTTSVKAPAGEVTIEFDNPASLSHDVVVEDADGNELARTDVITGGSTSTTAQLDPGEYTFFCSVDAHRAAGMEGKLTAEG
jgi:plastocyanin